MNGLIIRKNSAEHQLAELMIESKFKILESKLIKEGFFDDLKRGYRTRKAEIKADRNRKRFRAEMRKPFERERKIQQEKESERLRRIRDPDGALPITGDLTKRELRKYYQTYMLDVPEWLQGPEDSADPREDADKDTLISRFADMVGLHPNKEKKLRKDINKIGGGVKATSNFLGKLYKDLTGTSFLPGSDPVPPPPPTPGPSPSSPTNNIQSFGSRIIAGKPKDEKMWYVWFENFKDYLVNKIKYVDELKNDPANTVDVNDLEAVAKSYIDNKITPKVITPPATPKVEYFPGGKKTRWEEIVGVIKNVDKDNDKTDFKKYLSGHFYAGLDGSGNGALFPIGLITGVKEDELKWNMHLEEKFKKF